MAFYFEKLVVWQKAYQLSKDTGTYTHLSERRAVCPYGPNATLFSLSIVSNIAEGSARGTDAEHKYFLSISQGSCMELATQLYLSYDFGYISLNQKEKVVALLDEIVKMLYVMIHK